MDTPQSKTVEKIEEISSKRKENRTVIVIRCMDNGRQTNGRLFVMEGQNIVFHCQTLELSWKDNQRNISCIPPKIYKCKKLKQSNAFGYPHIWIQGVMDRSGIKIHRANYARQLQGCIAVGEHKMDIDADGDYDITHSQRTLDKLLNELPDEFMLQYK